ncbi:MAG: tyrosine-type recombinase/integrase [Actinophytocola sp.]|uniref:tyrosine-type recombinase/integrase n=1 Tax=Actinophytocola sp. TaxID=1872138 RepID=UPI001327B242|nr:tyrosine-type recombinase/integrase [Actinophytocola sp.]MPZ81045.1 tyrosine-type recombinase/integrase [Actinophytocola sp.]
MLRVPTLSGALARVLATFRPCFTAPTFQTFTMLVAGLFAQPVGRTVCGMITGAGLTRIWRHGRAHRFFSTARWSPQQMGLVVAQLIVTHLLPAHAPITVAIDDTAAENLAFWEFAAVEVLRHAGIRIEELLELTHLSIRQYQRPNGEVIALLVIAPSKTDRERVIPMSAELFAVIAAIIRRHTQHGRPIPLIQRYDNHERRMSDPMPFLFQRHTGAVPRVISPATVLVMLRRRCAELAEQHPGFRATSFTPHDFRRLLATDLVNNGLPIHIGAALLGHLNLQTTRGYVAVFNEDVVRHYQEFLDRRRQARSVDEYKPVTDSEWSEFEEHFDRRKVELGGCTRPYGSACQHEHSCLRCPMLAINPKMLPRLDEIEDDLLARRARAEHEAWLGEVEGIDLTLTLLRQKRQETKRLARVAPVELGIPVVAAPR